MIEDPFVSLHQHSDYSSLDGYAQMEDLLRTAIDSGSPGIAITDHGNVAGIFSAWRLAKQLAAEFERPFRVIGGIELYVVKDRFHPRELWVTTEKPEEGTEGDQLSFGKLPKRHHLTLLIKDAEGYENAMRLVHATSQSAVRGGFGRWYPLADLDLIGRYAKGLICLSGCGFGPIPSLAVAGHAEEARRVTQRLRKLFGSDFYLEIMPSAYPTQAIVNQAMVDLADLERLPIVATNDSHWVREEEHETHQVLMAIQTHGKMEWPTRREVERWEEEHGMKYPGRPRFCLEEPDYYFRGRAAMETAFAAQHPHLDSGTVSTSLDTTLEVLEKVSYEHEERPISLSPFRLPELWQRKFEEWREENGLERIGGWQWPGIGSAAEFQRHLGSQRGRAAAGHGGE